MKEDKAMFEDAVVGDRIWNERFGWSTITEILPKKKHPIHMKLDTFHYLIDDKKVTMTLCGRYLAEDLNPTFFYDEIKFDIPSRPKRRTKKTIERHVNVYPNRDDCSHVTEAEANICKSPDRIACVKLTGSYFVEE